MGSYKKEYEEVFEGKTILITGGLGFIGSNLAHKLVELNPKKVIIADALVNGLGGSIENIKEIKDKLEIYAGLEGDIRNIQKIKELVSQADYVFNLAGSIRHTGHNREDLIFDSEINLICQTLFLEACRQCMIENPKKNLSIIYAGARDQYGKVSFMDLPLKEDFVPKTFTDYQSISKGAAEAHHIMLHSSLKEQGIDGIKITSVRITNTYGPRQSLDCGGAVPTFIKKILSGGKIELWGGGEVLRDFNHVDDVVDALILLAASDKTGGQIYNLGCCIGKEGMNTPVGGNLTTIMNLAHLIRDISGLGDVTAIPYPKERASIEPGHCCSDISKIARLGWIPKYSLRKGLEETIRFYKEKTLNNKDY